MNYVDIMELTWKQLLIILTNGTFPTAYRALRKQATKLLLRQEVPPFLKRYMDDPRVKGIHDIVMILNGEMSEASADAFGNDIAISQMVDEDEPDVGIPPEQMVKLMGFFDKVDLQHVMMRKVVQEIAFDIRQVRRNLYMWQIKHGRKGGGAHTGQFHAATTIEEGQAEAEKAQREMRKAKQRDMIKVAPQKFQESYDKWAKKFAHKDEVVEIQKRLEKLVTQIDNLGAFMAVTNKYPQLDKEIKLMERKVAVTGILHKKLQSKVMAEVRAFEVFKERREEEDNKVNARQHQAAWDLHG